MRTLVPEKAQSMEGTAMSTNWTQNHSFYLCSGRGVGKVLVLFKEEVTNSQERWCLSWLSLYLTGRLRRVENAHQGTWWPG